MFYDHYLIVPEYIRHEIECVLSEYPRLKGIKPVYFNTFQASQPYEVVNEITGEQSFNNDILLICDSSYPEISVPHDYSGSVKTHDVGAIYSLFAEKRSLKEHEDAGSFIVVSGWLEQWLKDPETSGPLFSGSISLDIDTCPYVLVLDTGIYPGLPEKAQEFYRITGIPVKLFDIGIEHFALVLENIVLQWNIEKKQNQLKMCNRKAASYAMSIDFIKELADLTDESVAIDSICKLFSTMFAPDNVVYHSFHDGEMSFRYCKSPDMEMDSVMKLKDSDSSYIVFEKEDGFAVKIKTKDDVLGIVEVHGVAFPENLDEYISIAYDLAKASGLAISNIRRYHEVFRSREDQIKLAEMLRTTNHILRHDIANDLQVISGALDLLEERYDEKFISMIRKASQKGVSLIRNVREVDDLSAGTRQLELLNVRSLIEDVISRHEAEFSIKGNCLVMADKALSSVIDNLIRNALDHGNADRIEIDINDQSDICSISIADNGAGIPTEVQPLIFDEGFKYGKTGHTGLGLHIVRKTIERYKGSIRVEDNIPSGATFVIELANGRNNL